MSRSRRKTPITGFTCAETEKWDKRHANRKLRRLVRILIQVDFFYPLPLLREVSNVWDFDKDGRQFFDPIEHPKLMRK